MFDFPPVPSWDALHPGVSHFPIALLLLVPFCLGAALWLTRHRATLAVVALGLTFVGTVGVYLAASTGDGARDVAREAAPQAAEVKAAVEAHENLGSIARAVFSGLTVLLAAFVLAPHLLKRELTSSQSVACLAVLLVLFLVAGLILLNAAHTGGLLVHKLGMHARIH
ncbi:MAG TPA: hypothetical protein PLS53_05790 [Thermoanaerobaculaceae bacterium]|nr:hypothetical protein [Thermoanaerobaculaceae bacterium]HPS77651.1 hypothetical protein [Thermoanaerobaculaceae bacterium]